MVDIPHPPSGLDNIALPSNIDRDGDIEGGGSAARNIFHARFEAFDEVSALACQ